jgi:hypothetical protein
MNTKFLGILVTALMLSLAPVVLANDTGVPITPEIESDDFVPQVVLCGNRVVTDDEVEGGRITGGGEEIQERLFNYLFEGEMIFWEVLVFDKNGIEKIRDVYGGLSSGGQEAEDFDIEVNCDLGNFFDKQDISTCNLRYHEEWITELDVDTMAMYDCKLTVETPASMYGEHWISIIVEDLDGLFGSIDENEWWFLNPEIGLAIDGSLDFGVVTPGTTAYSDTLVINNDVDPDSGVLLDMFISGTDFYDPESSGAKCPVSNVLALTNFDYYAVTGPWSTEEHDGRSDFEGYIPIGYGDRFDSTFYFVNDIILNPILPGGYSPGNLLGEGAEMSVTLRLEMPEPCNGDFSEGAIFFWAEAV